MTRILWSHPRPWGPARNGGDLRTRGLILSALGLGHEVLLVAPSGGGSDNPSGFRVQPYVGPRTRFGVSMRKAVSRDPLRSPRLRRVERSRLRDEIHGWGPEIAVVSEVMSWSVARQLLPSDLPMIYDAQNVEKQRFKEMARSATTAMDRLTLSVDVGRVGRAERALARRASAIMAVSQEDRDALAQLTGQADIRVVPSSVATPDVPALPAEAGPSVLFVGSLDYQPNHEAAVELVHEIWPVVVSTVPSATLDIVGRRPARALQRMVRDSASITLHADVDSVEPYYLGARAVVAPLRTGGGTKLKVYEAMAYGLPLVATPQALHGVRVPAGVIVRADTAPHIAHALVRFLRNPSEAGEIGAGARITFVDEMSWERASAPVLDEMIRCYVRAPE